MPPVTIRFRGLCCFIKDTNGGKYFQRRVVLPTHDHSMDIEHHTPHIEFLADDLKKVSQGLSTIAYKRPGDEGQYERIELNDAVMIEFLGLEGEDKRITEGPTYKGSAISLHGLAGEKRTLEMKDTVVGPRDEVDPDLIAAVIDLPPGTLLAGPPEATITRFLKPANFEPRRVARWLEHVIDVNGDFRIRLTPLGKPNATPETIYFEDTTRLVTIGNEPERMIVGHFVPPPAGRATPPRPTGHFAVYWNLFTNIKQTERFVPEPFQGSVPGCAPSTRP